MSVKTWYEIRRKGKCVNLVPNKKMREVLDKAYDEIEAEYEIRNLKKQDM